MDVFLRDGHERCDNKEATKVISKQIVGGCNPLQWDTCNSYKSTKDSFILSFTRLWSDIFGHELCIVYIINGVVVHVLLILKLLDLSNNLE